MSTRPTLPLTVAGRERDVDCGAIMLIEDDPHWEVQTRVLNENATIVWSAPGNWWVADDTGSESAIHITPEQIAALMIWGCKQEYERLLRAKYPQWDWDRGVLGLQRRSAVRTELRLWLPLGRDQVFIAEVKHEYDAHDLEPQLALLEKVRALCGEDYDG